MGKFKDLITDPEQNYISDDGKHIIIQPEYFSLLDIIRSLEKSYYEKQATRGITDISERTGNILNWGLYPKNENLNEA